MNHHHSRARKRVPRYAMLMLLFLFPLLRGKVVRAQSGEPPQTPSVQYEIERFGRVSAAVYDKDGTLVRTLLRAKPQGAGEHTLRWDGLNRAGEAVAPGEYRWKILRTDGLRSELITKVGVNPAPWWEAGIGNHSSPGIIAADAGGYTLIPGYIEGGFKIAKIRPDRQYVWAATSHNWRRLRAGAVGRIKFQHRIRWGYKPCAAASTSGRVLILSRNGRIYGINAENGRKAGDSWSVKWDGDPQQLPRSAMDMDAGKDALVVSYRQHDALRWYDLATGEVLAERTDIKKPAGVAVLDGGGALVISGGSIKRVNRTGKDDQTIIEANRLDSPWRLDTSAQTGEIFVAENSAPYGKDVRHHQVKRFSQSGELLASFGRASGRTDGRYDAGSFLRITDITCDTKGGFLVAEPLRPPRRIARFGADGELTMQFFGAPPYGTGATPEPGNPRRVWYSTGSGLVRAKVDYSDQSWEVLETYFQDINRNVLCGVGKGVKIFDIQGRTYLSTFAGSLLLYDSKEKSLRPTNAIGKQYLDYKGWRVPERLRDEKPKYGIRTGYIWNDLNADGRATRDELELYNAWRAGGPNGYGIHYTDEMDVIYSNGKRLRAESITSDGVPIYDPGKAESFIGGMQGLYHSPEGHWYRTISGALRGEKWGIYWYPGTRGTDRLIKYDDDLNRVWAVGRHNARWDHEPGWSHSMEGVAGETHGCIVVDGNFGDTELVGPMVWTQDGLYVGELCVRPHGNLPEFVYKGSKLENPRGTVMDDPKTGDTFFFAHGNNSAPIWRIHGWDGWERQSGNITLRNPMPHADAEGTGLKAQYFDNPDWSGPPAIERVDERVFFNWKKNPPGENVKKRGFSVRWTGSVEAPLTETFAFVIRTGTRQNADDNPVIKLWIDGQLACDSTSGLRVDTRNYRRQHWKVHVPMKAGQRYNLRLEYSERGSKENFCHLAWGSPSTERQSIESRYLYPERVEPRGIDPLPEWWSFGDDDAGTRGGLIAHIPFDETDGLVARSRVGRGIYGNLHGDAAWVDGVRNGALRLEGGLCSVCPELRMPHTNYTVAFWFRSQDADGRLLSANRKPTFHNNFQDSSIRLRDGKVAVQLARETIRSQQAHNDGQWHHVAVVVEKGKGFRLYLDGSEVSGGKTDRMGTWHLWHVPTERLGMRVGPADRTTDVTIDDLRVYDKPLSPEKIEDVRKNRNNSL